jgi:hypothetical protein
MNSLGWSRRADVPVNTSKQTGLLSSIKSLNPFGNEGSVRLPTSEGPAGAPLPAPSRREEDDAWFACKCRFQIELSLHRWQHLWLIACHQSLKFQILTRVVSSEQMGPYPNICGL